MFDIAFVGDRWIDEDGSWQRTRLVLGDTVEEEYADLTHWSPEDYQTQWLTELTQLVTSRSSGALIVSIHDPIVGYRFWTWTMWRENDRVFFQNRIMFMLEGTDDFDPSRVSDYVGERQVEDEDGNRISTWTVPLEAVEAFVRSHSQ